MGIGRAALPHAGSATPVDVSACSRHQRARAPTQSEALQAQLPVVGLKGNNQLVQIAVEDGLQTVQVQPDAMVRAAVLREVVRANPIRAVPRADHRLAGLVALGSIARHVQLVHAAD